MAFPPSIQIFYTINQKMWLDNLSISALKDGGNMVWHWKKIQDNFW